MDTTSTEIDVDVQELNDAEKVLSASNILSARIKEEEKLAAKSKKRKGVKEKKKKWKRMKGSVSAEKAVASSSSDSDELTASADGSTTQEYEDFGDIDSTTETDCTGTIGYSDDPPESPDPSLPDLPSSDEKGSDPNPAEFDEMNSSQSDDYVKKCLNELKTSDLLENFLVLLNTNGCLKDFMSMVRLVVLEHMTPLNIPFLLCLDVAKLKSKCTTTAMFYRKETRKFWEVVYRFGGGAMIRLFSGLKNFGHVCLKKCRKNYYDPLEGDITFAVPDVKILSKSTTDATEKIQPGFIEINIDKIDRSKQYNLSVDGKKISPGCGPNNEGDIYLFGLEEPSLEYQNRRLQEEMKMLDNIAMKEENNPNGIQTSISDVENILKKTSKRIMDLRKTQCHQELVKITFQKMMDKDASLLNKYTQAISSIETFQVFSNALVERVLEKNKDLCLFLSNLRNNLQNFITGKHVSLESQGNCVTLRPPHNIALGKNEALQPQYIKQGTQEWLQLRKESLITSSTAFKALGMDTVKCQQDHFKHFVLKQEEKAISPELQRLFDHGRENEVHAFGTLAGIVLPALMNNCKQLTQVGSFFIDGDNVKRLAEVSPDGLITTFNKSHDCRNGRHIDDDDMSVEFKCPLGENKFVLPVHYTVPIYYVPQLLFQMKVLNVLRGIYATYSKQSMTVIRVQMDTQLWNDMWSLTKQMYDKVNLKHLVRCSLESKELKDKLKQFVHNNCEFILEIPSCTASETPYLGWKHQSVFRMGKRRNESEININDWKRYIIDVCDVLKSLINECYEMQRRKATEILLFILSDLDRMFMYDSPHCFPVAYAMKGYSLDVKTMRRMIDIVLDKLRDEGIDVVTTSFDGQWFNLAVKGEENEPLTKMQLQRKVWSKVGRITKENILKQIDSFTRVNKDLEEISNLQMSSNMEIIGNMKIERHGKIDDDGNIDEGHPIITLSCEGGASGIDRIMNKIHTPSEDDRPDLWVQDYVQENEMGPTQEVILQMKPDANLLTLLPEQFLQSKTMTEAIDNLADELHSSQINDEATASSVTSTRRNKATAFSCKDGLDAEFDKFEHSLLNVNPKFLQDILDGIKKEKRGKSKWAKYTIKMFYADVLQNQKKIEKLTSYEMDVISDVFCKYKGKKLFKSNDLKPRKVLILCRLFGRERHLHVQRPKNTKRITLRKLCLDIIKDIEYPTIVAAVALANCYHWEEKKLWLANVTAPMKIKLPSSNTVHEAFSYPYRNPRSKRLHFNMLDPTHMLTNMRSHICGKGYKDIGSKHFLRVSEKDNELLNRAYVVNCLDKQSAPIAQRFFSIDVQRIMLENGDDTASDIVGIIRGWYDAVDKRGLSVATRCALMQDMFDWLNSYIEFEVYPPPKQYIAGFPTVTFESLLQNISSRFQLYFFTKKNKYNHRSISSLEVETEFGYMSRMDGSYNGCPKSVMVSTQIQRLIQRDHLQSDPTKGFSINVSHRKKYPDHVLLSTEDTSSAGDEDESFDEMEETDFFDIQPLKFTTHKFDKPMRRQRKKRCKNVDVATGNKPIKRESGVRIHYKAADSRIKCTTRHGLPN